MPDPDDLRAKLQAKNAWRACPACAANDWTVGTELAIVQGCGDDWQLHALGRGWPVTPVFCANCGFTRLHNVTVLGVERAEPDPEGVGSPESGKEA